MWIDISKERFKIVLRKQYCMGEINKVDENFIKFIGIALFVYEIWIFENNHFFL